MRKLRFRKLSNVLKVTASKRQTLEISARNTLGGVRSRKHEEVSYPEVPHPQSCTGHGGRSAHQRVGADGIWVTSSIVAIIALIDVIADLKDRVELGLTDTEVGIDGACVDPKPEEMWDSLISLPHRLHSLTCLLARA